MVVIGGCTADDDPQDPAGALTDPDTGEDLSGAPLLVHERGRGPVTVPLTFPRDGAVWVYVTCESESEQAPEYKVTFGGAYSSNCSPTSPVGGGFSRQTSADATELVLDLPKDTEWWLVAVAGEDPED